jgi:hypothetical protein
MGSQVRGDRAIGIEALPEDIDRIAARNMVGIGRWHERIMPWRCHPTPGRPESVNAREPGEVLSFTLPAIRLGEEAVPTPAFSVRVVMHRTHDP